MAGLNFRLPNINQLITLAIAMAVLFFIVKLLPGNIQQWFRV